MTFLPSNAYARVFAAAYGRQRWRHDVTPARRTLQAGQALHAAAGLPTSFSALTPNAA